MHLLLSHRAEQGRGFRSPLQAAHKSAIAITNHVQAAVAYVSTETNPVLADCAKRGIRCEVYSRHDESLPTALPVMHWALKQMSKNANLSWRLVSSYFHPKVIWWHGYGVYIGSANLTDSAWNANCEAGVVIFESELDEYELRQSLMDFFSDIHQQSIDLDKKVYDEAEELLERHKEIEAIRRKLLDEYRQSETGSILTQKGSLSEISKTSSYDRARNEFLTEWRNALTILKSIQERLQKQENIPIWIHQHVAPGILTDQFLHAYYYDHVREGKSYPVEKNHELHKADPELALNQAIEWWRNTTTAPSSEEIVFTEWAPVYAELLTIERLNRMTSDEFVRVARRVHAIRGYAKRRKAEELAPDEDAPNERMTMELKLDIHCKELYEERNLLNWSPPELLKHLFFGGPAEDAPSRLFECIHDPKYKIPRLNISSLGELVGCGLPNVFPPRNDRTNKALRALGVIVIGSRGSGGEGEKFVEAVVGAQDAQVGEAFGVFGQPPGAGEFESVLKHVAV